MVSTRALIARSRTCSSALLTDTQLGQWNGEVGFVSANRSFYPVVSSRGQSEHGWIPLTTNPKPQGGDVRGREGQAIIRSIRERVDTPRARHGEVPASYPASNQSVGGYREQPIRSRRREGDVRGMEAKHGGQSERGWIPLATNREPARGRWQKEE